MREVCREACTHCGDGGGGGGSGGGAAAGDKAQRKKKRRPLHKPKTVEKALFTPEVSETGNGIRLYLIVLKISVEN